MTEGSLPESVRSFLLTFVHSFEELKVLLFARGFLNQPFSAEGVAPQLGLTAEAVTTALEALEGRGVVRRARGNTPTYLYAPTDDLDARVAALAEADAKMRFEIVEVMSSNAISRLKSSAVHTFSETLSLNKAPKRHE